MGEAKRRAQRAPDVGPLTIGDVVSGVAAGKLLRVARPTHRSSAGGAAVRGAHIPYVDGQLFGAPPGVPFVFALCRLDPRAILDADHVSFRACFIEGHGGLTADVRIEERDGSFFARISTLDSMTTSTEGARLLRGEHEGAFYVPILARYLERTTGVGYDAEWETEQGKGVGGNPQIDGRLHPRDGTPPIDLQLTHASSRLAGEIGAAGTADAVRSARDDLQRAIDDKAVRRPLIWTAKLKASTHLVLILPLNGGALWREGLRLYPPDARGFAALWLCTPDDPPLRLR